MRLSLEYMGSKSDDGLGTTRNLRTRASKNTQKVERLDTTRNTIRRRSLVQRVNQVSYLALHKLVDKFVFHDGELRHTCA